MPDTLTIPVRLTADGKLDPLEDRLVKEIRDLKENMKQSDVTEQMYLDEIKKRDIDNLRLIIKNAKTYEFESAQHAFAEIGQFLNRAFCKLGVNALDYHAKRIDPENTNDRFVSRRLTRQLLKKKVHWEARFAKNYPPEDRWRSGIYIYHNNEISYWISNVLGTSEGRSGNGHIILPGKRRWFVKTNAPGA